MLKQIGKPLFKCLKIFVSKLGLCSAAVMLKRTNGGDDNYCRGGQPCHAAFYIKEFFRAEVSAEACLRNGVIAELHCHFGCDDGVAAVSDVGERTAVDNGGGMLKRLHQIGLYCVLQKSRHCARCLQVARSYGFAFVAVGYDDA